MHLKTFNLILLLKLISLDAFASDQKTAIVGLERIQESNGKTVAIAASNSVIREKPNSTADKQGLLTGGSRIAANFSQHPEWAEVQLNNKIGYTHKSNLIKQELFTDLNISNAAPKHFWSATLMGQHFFALNTSYFFTIQHSLYGSATFGPIPGNFHQQIDTELFKLPESSIYIALTHQSSARTYSAAHIFIYKESDLIVYKLPYFSAGQAHFSFDLDELNIELKNMHNCCDNTIYRFSSTTSNLMNAEEILGTTLESTEASVKSTNIGNMSVKPIRIPLISNLH